MQPVRSTGKSPMQYKELSGRLLTQESFGGFIHRRPSGISSKPETNMARPLQMRPSGPHRSVARSTNSFSYPSKITRSRWLASLYGRAFEIALPEESESSHWPLLSWSDMHRQGLAH